MERRDFLKTSAALAAGGIGVGRAAAEDTPNILGSAASGKVDVGIARGSSMTDAVTAAVKLAGGMDFIKPGQTVLIKPNCTGAAKNPTTTSPEVLYAVIKLIAERGPKQIYVSDRSFSTMMMADPEKALLKPKTVDVMKAVGQFDAIEQAKSELKAPVIAVGLEDANTVFESLGKKSDTYAWRRVKPEGAKHWPNGFELGELLFSVDHVINVPVIKTHFQAWFTMSMKAFVGMSHHRTRMEFHKTYAGGGSMLDPRGAAKRRRGVKRDPKAEFDVAYPFVGRIAELNLGIKPSLNILDGTDSFVSGGPHAGDTAQAKVIVASTDRIAADATGIAVLKSLGTEERLMTRTPWECPFIYHGVKIGLGIDGPAKLNLKSDGIPEIDKIKKMLVAPA